MKYQMFLAIICTFFLLCSCSFTADVYISFYWNDDTALDDENDEFKTGGIPNVPTTFDGLTKGNYYKTIAGEYTVIYKYFANSEERRLKITLEANSTVLGIENAYYDFYIRKGSDPSLYKIPPAPDEL